MVAWLPDRSTPARPSRPRSACRGPPSARRSSTLPGQGWSSSSATGACRTLQTSIHDLEEIPSPRRPLPQVPAAHRAAEQASPETIAALRAELASMREAAQRDDEVTTMTHDRRFHELINEASGERAAGQVRRLAARPDPDAGRLDRRPIARPARDHRPTLRGAARGRGARRGRRSERDEGAHLQHRVPAARAGDQP